MKPRITPRQLAREALAEAAAHYKGQRIPSAMRKPIEDKLTAWLTAAAAVIALEEAVSQRQYAVFREGFLKPRGVMTRKEWIALVKAIKGGRVEPSHYVNGIVRQILARTPRVELEEKRRKANPLIVSAMHRGRVRK